MKSILLIGLGRFGKHIAVHLNKQGHQVMAVDISKAGIPLTELAERLSELGKTLGISIRIQREEIFNAMHRI